MEKLYVPSLSEEQQVELEELYRKTEVPRVRTRSQMVLLSAEKKLKVDEIADIVRGSSVTVLRWLHRYIAEGIQGLMDAPRAGRPPKLTDDQILVLREILAQGAITHGWHNELWTAKRVLDIIQRRFEVKISIPHVRILLRKRLGWTSQRPSQIESKRDEIKIADWKENIFPKIVTYTYSRNAYLVFIDEAGFMASPVRRQTYAPRGKHPIVKVTEPHRRISTAGAITVSPKKQSLNFLYHVLPINQNFRGNTIVIFLKEIASRIRNPMTILWDGFSIHISEPVNKFLEEHPEILIEPLPEYAHELNPVDKIWLYLKYDCLANYAPQTLDDLRDRLLQELDALPLKSNVLAWCIEQTGLKTHLS